MVIKDIEEILNLYRELEVFKKYKSEDITSFDIDL
jgi:hypothetical protein